jgi:hypothetical protein
MVTRRADVHGADSIKKIDSVSLALKLDGEEMRDAAYVIKAAGENHAETESEAPLAKDSLRLSSSDTIVAVSSRVETPRQDARLPDPHSDPTGVLQLLASYIKMFTDQGLGAQQLAQAFGPESGFLLDWPAGTMIPTPLAMLDVKDAALAHKFLDTLMTLPVAAGVAFTHQEAGGISYYSLPPTGIGFFPLRVTLGLSGKCVIGALSPDAVKHGAMRYVAHGPGLEGTDGYKRAAALVSEPTSSFGYVDTKAIFGRVYGLFRGVASMGFIPHLSDYVDVGKLPAPETITRHLSPLVTSGSVQDGGLLMESAGPVASSEGMLATAITVGAVALPLVEKQMQGQYVTIPRFPGLGAKGGNAGGKRFASPWSSKGSAGSTPPVAPGAGAIPAPSASASGGTP